MRGKDLKFVWQALSGEEEVGFVEPLRSELAGLVRSHIERLMIERATAERPTDFDGRLKNLAVILAEMDGNASFHLVLDILSMPETGTWLYGGRSRVHGLEALLMKGLVLPFEKTWDILEPVIQHARAHRFDSNESSLLTRAACIALFTDDPGSSLARVRELVRQNLLSVEGVEQLTYMLGYTRCADAVSLLQDLVEAGRFAEHLGATWIDALAHLDTEEARDLLLSFIDPSLPALPTGLLMHQDERLVTRLAEMVDRYPDVQLRVFALVNSPLSDQQGELLAKLLVKLGSVDAILRVLELLNDDVASAASREVRRGVKEAFVEQRPLAGSRSTFTLVPRSSNEIRRRLLHMVQNDPRRRKSAYALLSEIELWRLQHGRPDSEPRSPVLPDGSLWPLQPPV